MVDVKRVQKCIEDVLMCSPYHMIQKENRCYLFFSPEDTEMIRKNQISLQTVLEREFKAAELLVAASADYCLLMVEI